MTGRGGLTSVVPSTFDAFARIDHRIHNGERWATFAPEYLVRGTEMYDYVGSKLEFIDGDGNLDAEDVGRTHAAGGDSDNNPARLSLRPVGRLGLGAPGSMHRRSTFVWLSQADAADHARALQDALEAEMTPVWSFAATCPVEPW